MIARKRNNWTSTQLSLSLYFFLLQKPGLECDSSVSWYQLMTCYVLSRQRSNRLDCSEWFSFVHLLYIFAPGHSRSRSYDNNNNEKKKESRAWWSCHRHYVNLREGVVQQLWKKKGGGMFLTNGSEQMTFSQTQCNRTKGACYAWHTLCIQKYAHKCILHSYYDSVFFFSLFFFWMSVCCGLFFFCFVFLKRKLYKFIRLEEIEGHVMSGTTTANYTPLESWEGGGGNDDDGNVPSSLLLFTFYTFGSNLDVSFKWEYCWFSFEK